MGHESPIEPWLAPDNRAACGLRTDRLRRPETDENRWQRKPKALAECSSVPRSRNGRPEQSCSTRWAGSQEKIRPQEKCFFLYSFYRTNQELALWVRVSARVYELLAKTKDFQNEQCIHHGKRR